MENNKKGFIVLAMFVMLTLCATMVSLFIVRGMMYRQSIGYFLSAEKMNLQLQSGLAVVQNLLDQKSVQKDSQQQSKSGGDQVQVLTKFLLGRSQKVTSEMFGEKPGVTIDGILQPECGKININGLYDFANKKFVKEGESSGDRKKLAEWLFSRIAQIKGGVSLFSSFADYLKRRSYPLNDVTELLLIPEFADYFEDAIFVRPSKDRKKEKLCLTDLFTVVSETDTIQPWVLSPSLITLLGGSAAVLNEKTLEGPMKNFSQKMDWAKKWNETVGILYGIKFDNLTEEMKSILTQQFEVNIFSITLSMHDEKNKAGLYSLLKKTEKNGLSTYDIVRMYQI